MLATSSLLGSCDLQSKHYGTLRTLPTKDLSDLFLPLPPPPRSLDEGFVTANTFERFGLHASRLNAQGVQPPPAARRMLVKHKSSHVSPLPGLAQVTPLNVTCAAQRRGPPWLLPGCCLSHPPPRPWLEGDSGLNDTELVSQARQGFPLVSYHGLCVPSTWKTLPAAVRASHGALPIRRKKVKSLFHKSHQNKFKRADFNGEKQNRKSAGRKHTGIIFSLSGRGLPTTT